MIIKENLEEIQSYLTDASNFKGNCEKVFFPENRNDIIEVVIKANEQKATLTVAGNGTGLTGARVPINGWVLATDKLNKIIEINKKEKYAIVQPAVLLSKLQSEVEGFGLLYPPDPTEKDCYLGGTVATNASGAKTFKYGPTRNYIQALDITLPDGDSIYLERGQFTANENLLALETKNKKNIEFIIPDIKSGLSKNAAGYFLQKNMDAIDLFIGSEGTLGIFNEIKLKLLDKPGKVLSCVAFFPSEDDALNFLTEARKKSEEKNKTNGINALALEYFDEGALEFMKSDYSNIPDGAKAAVWFEEITKEENEISDLENWISIIKKFHSSEDNVWFAADKKDKNEIENFRHAVSANVNEFITSQGFRKLGTDVAVPDYRLIEYYNLVKKISSASGIHTIVYGHFGNSHIHLNLLPKTEAEFERGKKVYDEICLQAIKFGGTISAEHGVGKLKKKYLIDMYGKDVVKMMWDIKRKLDPNNILGTGNVLPEV